MKILVVDNGTHYKKRLNSLLDGHRVTTVSYKEIGPDLHKQGYELIVLSGAYGGLAVKDAADEFLAQEMEFIRHAKIPVIGLCYAAQLIAYMYGARLSRVPGGDKLKGIKLIWNVNQNPFDFFGYKGAKVWASQRWRITDLPKELECWCASAEGVEVFKHKNKPIYGLQFHPEHHTRDDDGRQIFEKIVELELGKTLKFETLTKSEAVAHMTSRNE
jgi:GMP synthase (glutamine-hydrolysing)